VISLIEIGQVVLEKIFKWPHPMFNFCDYLPFEKELAFYLNKLEFPSSKDNLYQVSMKSALWFLRRRFLNIFCVFLLFRYNLPLEKGTTLHLYKFESPPSKDDMCNVWLKLAQRFWRSRKCKTLKDRWTTDNS
jgi:hypothetical protein